MLLGRDSVTAADIPLAGLAVVMGYADGLYAWTAADWARFTCPKLTIAVCAAHTGDVLDVENGDAVPSDIPGWCDRFSRPGRRAPTIYCSLSAWTYCKEEAGSRRVDWWIADYTTDDPSKVTPIAGAVAQQYHDFGGYDESVIFDPTWIDPVVEDEMSLAMAQLTVWQWYVADWGCSRVASQAEVDGWATQLTAPGANYEAVVTAFYDSPECVANRAKRSQS